MARSYFRRVPPATAHGSVAWTALRASPRAAHGARCGRGARYVDMCGLWYVGSSGKYKHILYGFTLVVHGFILYTHVKP